MSRAIIQYFPWAFFDDMAGHGKSIVGDYYPSPLGADWGRNTNLWDGRHAFGSGGNPVSGRCGRLPDDAAHLVMYRAWKIMTLMEGNALGTMLPDNNIRARRPRPYRMEFCHAVTAIFAIDGKNRIYLFAVSVITIEPGSTEKLPAWLLVA